MCLDLMSFQYEECLVSSLKSRSFPTWLSGIAKTLAGMGNGDLAYRFRPCIMLTARACRELALV